MLNLSNPLTITAETLKAANLVDQFSDDDLKSIAGVVHDGYQRDCGSREKWLKRMEAALDLAMQVQKQKSFPWPNCSNVAFPLVTIATMQFHAMAYPSIISGKEVVKSRVFGDDPDGSKMARASRISKFMSYQVLEEDEPWEEGQDSLLINYAVVGTAFKKSYFGSEQHNVSELVMARDLVLDYWAKSVEDCPRKTHVIPQFRNDIYEKVKSGTFKDVLEEAWYQQPPSPKVDKQTIKVDNRAGIKVPQADETTPFTTLEQHVSLDLDCDGYAEPYIITIEEQSLTVLRIVTRWERPEDMIRSSKHAFNSPEWWTSEIVKIRPTEYFTRYIFLPSPDGGIYGLGFGILLGPLNESINSAINQLIDCGTAKNMGGGFLARGVKVRGGVIQMQPFGWQRVESSGDDLRKSMVPFPIPEPSAVMFQLIQLLIDYTNRISGTTEASLGEDLGQNTPAYNMKTMVSQGQKVYAAIFKRCWRSMKEEFKKLYKLNAVYMVPGQQVDGPDGIWATKEDFLGDPRTVIPAADPNIVSIEEKRSQATMIMQKAYSTPGYNYVEAEKRWLSAFSVDSPETIYPGPGKVDSQVCPPLPDPKGQIEQGKQQLEQAKIASKEKMFAMQLMETKRLDDAEILKLNAEVAALESDPAVQGDQAAVERLKAFVEARKSHNDLLQKQIDVMMHSADERIAQIDHMGKLVEHENKRVELANTLVKHETEKVKAKHVTA